jgi:hypothetical protein
VSGLTHATYNCKLPVPGGAPRLVTQAGSYGRLLTDIRLTVKSGSGDIDRAATYAATNVPVTRDEPDERVQAIIDYWTAGPGSPVAPGTDGGQSSAAPAPVPTGQKARPILAVTILGLIAIGLGLWLWHSIVARRRLRGIPPRRGRGRVDRRDPQPSPPA